MEYHRHWELEGKHAYLSPSGSRSWLNYDKNKMRSYYANKLKKDEGTWLHDLASRLIKSRKRLAPQKNAFNQFVNDAIGFRMESEIVLYYSNNIFGTADALLYKEKERHLQIHDLKTGNGKVHFDQLYTYAALFCLEYDMNPLNLTFEFRLYQGNGFEVDAPDGELIKVVMDKIIMLDEIINEERENYKGIY